MCRTSQKGKLTTSLNNGKVPSPKNTKRVNKSTQIGQRLPTLKSKTVRKKPVINKEPLWLLIGRFVLECSAEAREWVKLLRPVWAGSIATTVLNEVYKIISRQFGR